MGNPQEKRSYVWHDEEFATVVGVVPPGLYDGCTDGCTVDWNNNANCFELDQDKQPSMRAGGWGGGREQPHNEERG